MRTSPSSPSSSTRPMPPEGQNIVEHVAPEIWLHARALGRQSRDDPCPRRELSASPIPRHRPSRIYNTFDAHRLLHWAEIEGHQAALKQSLFERLFHRSSRIRPTMTVLVAAAEKAGLDPDAAREILASGRVCGGGPPYRAALAAARHPAVPGDRHRRPLPHLRRPAAEAFGDGTAQDRGRGGLSRLTCPRKAQGSAGAHRRLRPIVSVSPAPGASFTSKFGALTVAAFPPTTTEDCQMFGIGARLHRHRARRDLVGVDQGVTVTDVAVIPLTSAPTSAGRPPGAVPDRSSAGSRAASPAHALDPPDRWRPSSG